MATTSETHNAFGPLIGSYEEQAARIRALNQQLIEAAVAAGSVTVDAYERTLQTLVDFSETVTGATQVEWLSALVQAHADFVRDVSTAYTTALRSLLG
jgi:hypothetical protein